MAGQLPDERLQQHDRQQHVDPRGRRHRARRRAERAGLQQHDHEEPDDGHGRDAQRAAGPGRAVDRAPTATQLQATLPGAARPTFSNPLLFNNIFWDNRAGTRAGTTVTASASPATRPRSTTGTWASPTAPGTLLADELGGPADDGTRTRASADQHGRSRPERGLALRRLGVVRHLADEPGLRRTRSSSALDLPPNLLGDYHLASRGRSPSTTRSAEQERRHLPPPSDIDGDTTSVPAVASTRGRRARCRPSRSRRRRRSRATSVLDNFNRANSTNLGGNWSGRTPATASTRARSRSEERAAPPKRAVGRRSARTRRRTSPSATSPRSTACNRGLALKSSPRRASMIRITYDRAASSVTVATVTGSRGDDDRGDPGRVVRQRQHARAPGSSGSTVDRLPEQRTRSGRPTRERGRVTGGQIGIWFSGTTNTAAGNARIDDFGGGTLP